MIDDLERSQAGFNVPRPTDDPMVAVQYNELGLGDAPSLEDIEPHAVSMLGGGKVMEALSLVMGRTVDVNEVRGDDLLRGAAILATQEPQQAFGVLLLRLASDQVREEQA